MGGAWGLSATAQPAAEEAEARREKIYLDRPPRRYCLGRFSIQENE
jgi:hypothetical protein